MFELSKKDQTQAGSANPSQQDRDRAAAGSGSATGRQYPGSSSIAVIGRSITIEGDVRGEEDLRIEGDIKGNIFLPNHSLTIGTEGRINADVYAKSVTIDGEINGDVYGSECVSVRASARLIGNIIAARVSLEEGARFKGSIDMDAKSIKSALDKVQSSQPSRTEGGRPNGPTPARPTPANSPTAGNAS
ncbi:MAG TPA: polymer-forming cytoskeletal protein [Gammaproteobacteria bacterium]|jgi:cytoskeletal protein CcmA (bactofilin family)